MGGLVLVIVGVFGSTYGVAVRVLGTGVSVAVSVGVEVLVLVGVAVRVLVVVGVLVIVRVFGMGVAVAVAGPPIKDPKRTTWGIISFDWLGLDQDNWATALPVFSKYSMIMS
jgi:hypothetical protein